MESSSVNQNFRQQQLKSSTAQHIHEKAKGGKKCFHCGANISLTAEICPTCGRPVNPNFCTFCGNPMEMEDLFCSECGNSRKGIVCPECGTLNFRSFCRKCNYPLDHLAQAEMEKATKDPVFQHVCELQKHIVELEEQLYPDDESTLSDNDNTMPLSDKDMTLANEYQSLLSIMQDQKIYNQTLEKQSTNNQQAEPSQPSEQPAQWHKKPENLKQLSEEYDAKVQEMNEMLSSMMPDPGTSPQIQRNYYSARKLPIIGTMKTKQLIRKKIGWVCNYCGYTHKQPSECAEPQLGGTWLYKEYEEEKIVTSKTYQYVD